MLKNSLRKSDTRFIQAFSIGWRRLYGVAAGLTQLYLHSFYVPVVVTRRSRPKRRAYTLERCARVI